jgi:hypothetical protein
MPIDASGRRGIEMEFIGEVITVATEGEVRRPARLEWRGRRYEIVRILASWRDYAIPAEVRRKKWTMRHHRNYYHVQTDSGERFEIYFDRGAKHPEWVLLKRLPAGHDAEQTKGNDHGGSPPRC